MQFLHKSSVKSDRLYLFCLFFSYLCSQTPVFVYTDYPEAELFVNGVSQGRQRKLTADEALALKGKDSLWLQRRFRLMWHEVV